MKALSFLFVKFKFVCFVFAFISLINQQINIQTIYSSITKDILAFHYAENDIEDEERIEDSKTNSDYLIPHHFFCQLSTLNFHEFHSRHLLYYYLIKQFTVEIIVPPPKF